jgi:pimeloyl-ACP methyl ester carboxylesterase
VFLAAYTACRDRLRAEGIALDSYNSAESARDMDDLRQALGYEQWNLYGISYGTRLALTYLRDFPAAVRSVVLDSTYPPEADITAEVAPNAGRALDELFAACARHNECGTAYPNLERDFFATIERLDAAPATATVRDTLGRTLFEAQITGDEFLFAVFLGLYSEFYVPALPRIIARTAGGDADAAGTLLGIPISLAGYVSDGMYVSVQCNEEISFSSPEAVTSMAGTVPELYHFIDTDISFQLCERWGAGQAARIENEPVATEAPVLVLAGQFDPITPPEGGRAVAERQSTAYFFEFPGLAHGVTTAGDCPLGIMIDFLVQPSAPPDGSCIDRLPPVDFVVF